MAEQELKACPFCGAAAAWDETYNLKCVSCSNVASACIGSNVGTVSVSEWNTRPIEQSLTARLSAAEAERDNALNSLDKVMQDAAEAEAEVERLKSLVRAHADSLACACRERDLAMEQRDEATRDANELRAEVDAMGLAMLRIRREAATIDDAMTIIDPFDLTAAARRQQGGTDAR